MAISQLKGKTKATGARYKSTRSKRKCDLGRAPTLTKLGERKTKSIKTRGGTLKPKLAQEQFANIAKDGKVQKSKILNISENAANRNYVRRNIMTKGTVIETEAGKARVTSRPGQDGVINAALL